MIKPLAAIIFNFILNIFINEENKPAYPVNLVLDEFTNFGRIDGIEDQISIIRQRGIPILFGCQNWLQLKKVYGLDDSGILYSQTATKFIFRAQDLDTAKKVSETLGRKTVVERKMSSSGHLTEREFGRPLMETDELMAMQDALIVTTPGIQPLMTKGYSWQDLTYATNLPAYERRVLDIDDRLTAVCERAAVDPEWVEKVELVDPEDVEESPPEKPEVKDEPKKTRSKPRPIEKERVYVAPLREPEPELVQEPKVEVVHEQTEEETETEPEDDDARWE